jgi:DNA-binding IclR family transcriptional regulator
MQELRNDRQQCVGKVAGAQTLQRGLSIIRLLTSAGPAGLRISEISKRLLLNRSTANRLVRALVEEGFVINEPGHQKYRLGPELLAAGFSGLRQYDFHSFALPAVQELARELGDTVLLGLPHGDEAVCVLREDGLFLRPAHQVVLPGARRPLGVGAGNCAILASLDDKAVTEVLSRTKGVRSACYEDFTDRAIWTRIAATRDIGYCVHPNLTGVDGLVVGVALCDPSHRAVGAVAVAPMSGRCGTTRCSLIGQRLMKASRDLTVQYLNQIRPPIQAFPRPI